MLSYSYKLVLFSKKRKEKKKKKKGKVSFYFKKQVKAYLVEEDGAICIFVPSRVDYRMASRSIRFLYCTIQ